MHYNRKKFEHLILVSPLFSLDRDSEYTAFKRESYRMVEYLYCYLLAIDKKKYEPYGCEITEVAIRCINNFDAEKGLFLHYFNAAWKKEYSHILGEKIQEDQYRGLRIPETDRRAVRNYIQLAERLEQQTTSNELYQKLSDAMELPLDRIMELAELSKLNVCGDCCKHSKGGERSIWEQIPGGEYAGYNIETTEELEAILDRIERAFQSLQARQKPIISDMITIKICSS